VVWKLTVPSTGAAPRRKLNHTNELPNNAGVRGSIVKVAHMVVVHTKQEWEDGLAAQAVKTAIRPPLRMLHGQPVPLEP
jgi:hypothetical protein